MVTCPGSELTQPRLDLLVAIQVGDGDPLHGEADIATHSEALGVDRRRDCPAAEPDVGGQRAFGDTLDERSTDSRRIVSRSSSRFVGAISSPLWGGMMVMSGHRNQRSSSYERDGLSALIPRRRNSCCLRVSIGFLFAEDPAGRLGQMSGQGPDGLLMALAPSNALVEAADVERGARPRLRQIAFAASTNARLSSGCRPGGAARSESSRRLRGRAASCPHNRPAPRRWRTPPHRPPQAITTASVSPTPGRGRSRCGTARRARASGRAQGAHVE
jgi:hypothetical protein